MTQSFSFVGSATYKFPLTFTSLRLMRMRGQYRGSTSGLFLQLHTGTVDGSTSGIIAAPANATKCLAEVQLFASTEFLYDRAIEPLNNAGVNGASGVPVIQAFPAPLIAVLSTTAGALTAATSEVGPIDVWFDFDGYEDPVGGLTIAGDLTTAVSGLQVWNEATGLATPKRLYKIEHLGTDGSTIYLLLFGKNSISNGDVPCAPALNTGASSTVIDQFFFGRSGIQPFQQDAGGTQRRGCFIKASTTSTFLTTPGSTSKIRAFYK